MRAEYIVEPLQNYKGRPRFRVNWTKIELYPDGLAFYVGDSVGGFIPNEVFELFLAQRARAAEGQADPCAHCGKGNPIYIRENGDVVHQIDSGDVPCLNLQK